MAVVWYNLRMEMKDILGDCVDLMAEHLKRGSTLELFRSLYKWPLDDAENIIINISRIDQHTKAALLMKIDRALMDSAKIPETAGEALMFRLRLENAIRMLTILSKAKVPCELKTTIPEEAVCWALTTLWTGSGIQWVYRTASAFCEGKQSALPWPLPA